MMRSQSDTGRTKAEAGFSLLEMMIALSILSLVVTIIWQSVAFGGSAQQKIVEKQRKFEKYQSLEAVRPMLRMALSPDFFEFEDEVMFAHAPNSLSFVTSGVIADGWRGLSLVKLTRESATECEDKVSLVLHWKTISPGQAPQTEWADQRELVRCVDDVTIIASGKDDDEMWFETASWKLDRMPQEIQIRITDGGIRKIFRSQLVYSQ